MSNPTMREGGILNIHEESMRYWTLTSHRQHSLINIDESLLFSLEGFEATSKRRN